MTDAEKALAKILEMRTWAGIWQRGEENTTSHKRLHYAYAVADHALGGPVCDCDYEPQTRENYCAACGRLQPVEAT